MTRLEKKEVELKAKSLLLTQLIKDLTKNEIPMSELLVNYWEECQDDLETIRVLKKTKKEYNL